MINIILTTCNRLDFTRQSIEALKERLTTPYRLIIVDNESNDGTLEYLLELEKNEPDIYKVIVPSGHKTISEAQDIGFQFVDGKYFIIMQDDIIIPKLEPDVIQHLIALMEANPDYAGISSRIQYIPNVNWSNGNLSEPSTALSAYFRINRTSDVKVMGGLGKRPRDDKEFLRRVKSIGKRCGWANNLWCNHLGHGIKDRGYKEYKRKWGVRADGTMNDGRQSPYPEINPITNIPL